MTQNLKTAGWREWASLPDLGVGRIKAKLDTGARTSALHVFNTEVYEKNNREWVRFEIHPIQENDALICESCSVPILDKRTVTSSTGHSEHRIIIETTIQMGKDLWPIEVSLANRDQMGFRFLIGRTALANRILVDPSNSYLISDTRRHRRKNRKKDEPLELSSQM
ncbi:ATP-dependent zinc protease [Candidatus Bealeia paramacronuclearis]|uniref:ATP-dependent zinc protease n=1 Tax=Candidatus Bealeia paramacronuclearis TaxID=1921001 RepID=A0ABZ2C4P7_9PROT|nr:ATP-dependent zinc protease [Candidatus Bealeia paramacronuclearis]